MRDIWFWQRIVSPHVVSLARGLARQGCQITYVAERELSDDRRKQGWVVPVLDGIDIRYASRLEDVQDCVRAASSDSIHFCEGLRANGLVSDAQKHLAKRGLQQWVLMETIDDDGWWGVLKRATYTALLKKHRDRTAGLLAIGDRTPTWLLNRVLRLPKVYPFAYFLEDRPVSEMADSVGDGPFTFAFIGQFVERKRLPILVEALASLENCTAELVVVGSGPLEKLWRAYAEERLRGRIHWRGRMSSEQVLELVQGTDCLVLPSRHDGWGAVVSEALMSGTPAICSDRCGSAVAVRWSEVGGVFRRDDMEGLAQLLSSAIAAGKPSYSDRVALARWASSLGAEEGAHYLLDILSHTQAKGTRPAPPWERRLP